MTIFLLETGSFFCSGLILCLLTWSLLSRCLLSRSLLLESPLLFKPSFTIAASFHECVLSTVICNEMPVVGLFHIYSDVELLHFVSCIWIVMWLVIFDGYFKKFVFEFKCVINSISRTYSLDVSHILACIRQVTLCINRPRPKNRVHTWSKIIDPCISRGWFLRTCSP